MDDIYIDITDGTGKANVFDGSYYVEGNVPYYQLFSIKPDEVEITSDIDTYNFTVSATGNVAFQITEDGTSSGTPIEGAIFYRCDASGNLYGDALTTNQRGALLFEHVPVDESIPPTFYVRQMASDGAHSFDNSVYTVVSNEDYKLINLANPKL